MGIRQRVDFASPADFVSRARVQETQAQYRNAGQELKKGPQALRLQALRGNQSDVLAIDVVDAFMPAY